MIREPGDLPGRAERPLSVQGAPRGSAFPGRVTVSRLSFLHMLSGRGVRSAALVSALPDRVRIAGGGAPRPRHGVAARRRGVAGGDLGGTGIVSHCSVGHRGDPARSGGYRYRGGRCHRARHRGDHPAAAHRSGAVGRRRPRHRGRGDAGPVPQPDGRSGHHRRVHRRCAGGGDRDCRRRTRGVSAGTAGDGVLPAPRVRWRWCLRSPRWAGASRWRRCCWPAWR